MNIDLAIDNNYFKLQESLERHLLYRETKAAEIIDKKLEINPSFVAAVYKVKDGLDLEQEDTAYHYVRRHMTHIVNADEDEKKS